MSLYTQRILICIRRSQVLATMESINRILKLLIHALKIRIRASLYFHHSHFQSMHWKMLWQFCGNTDSFVILQTITWKKKRKRKRNKTSGSATLRVRWTFIHPRLSMQPNSPTLNSASLRCFVKYVPGRWNAGRIYARTTAYASVSYWFIERCKKFTFH